METNTRLRVALVGWGAISRTVAELLRDAPIDIVAVAVRDTTLARPDLPSGTQLLSDPSELSATKPDVVAEAAGRASVGPWGQASLEAGIDFIVSSVSALADASLLASLKETAMAHGCQINIQPGALAGVEALSASRFMGLKKVEHRIVKPPKAWLDTPAETLCNLDSLVEAVSFFEDTAAETASQFPKNANVAMTTALAGVGPEATRVVLVADPTAATNRHEVTASGDFGEMSIAIANNPLPANPKTSAMAALSLARAIQNRVTAVVL